MMLLPRSWIPVRIECPLGKDYLYGFSNEIYNTSYTIFLTDLHHVWSEQLSRDEIRMKAKKYGVDDLNDSHLHVLLDILKEECSRDPPLKFTIESDQNGLYSKALTQVNVGFKWTMNLQMLSGENQTNFLVAINLQQLQNHNFLLSAIDKLERIVREKEKYSKFLEENYKVLNGDRLIRKYKSNITTDSASLDYKEQDIYNSADEGKIIQTRCLSDVLNNRGLRSPTAGNAKSLFKDRSWNASSVMLSLSHAEVQPERSISVKKEETDLLTSKKDEGTAFKDDLRKSTGTPKRPIYMKKIGKIRSPQKKLYIKEDPNDANFAP